MKLLLKSARQEMLANGRENHDRQEQGLEPVDFRPVVKLFTPDANCTWLLTELDPEDPDIAFSLCRAQDKPNKRCRARPGPSR